MDFGAKRNSIKYKLALSASQPADVRVARSPLPGLSIVKPSIRSMLKEEQLPPWKQPVKFVIGSPTASIQCSDFWSPKMKKNVQKIYFPSKTRSKVTTRFHSQDYDSEAKRAVAKYFPETRSSVVLPEIHAAANRPWKFMEQPRGRQSAMD